MTNNLLDFFNYEATNALDVDNVLRVTLSLC